MKKLFVILAAMAVSVMVFAEGPVDRTILKINDVNFNGYSLTNAASIGFSDGTLLYSTSAVVAASTTNAALLKGNIPIAAMTNGLTSTGVGVTLAAFNGSALTSLAGANLTGNIALARITNAMATAGSTIGGNISTNCLTNAVIGTMWKGLPTSTNGLVSGQLWLNSNVLTIFP